MNISVTNTQTAIPISQQNIIQAASRAIRQLKIKDVDLSIVFVGRQRMQGINREYLGHDYVTDVITFEYEHLQFKRINGEIFICPLVAKSQAKIYGHSLKDELVLYVIHGILHLCGYDDHKPSDIVRMRAMEQKLMKVCA